MQVQTTRGRLYTPGGVIPVPPCVIPECFNRKSRVFALHEEKTLSAVADR